MMIISCLLARSSRQVWNWWPNFVPSPNWHKSGKIPFHSVERYMSVKLDVGPDVNYHFKNTTNNVALLLLLHLILVFCYFPKKQWQDWGTSAQTCAVSIALSSHFGKCAVSCQQCFGYLSPQHAIPVLKDSSEAVHYLNRQHSSKI